MTTTDKSCTPESRADALTDEQIDTIAPEFLILGDGDTEHDSIDWRGFARAILAKQSALRTVALPDAPVRPEYDADAVRFGECDHCNKRSNIRPHDGAMICGSCADADYLTAWIDHAEQLRALLAASPVEQHEAAPADAICVADRIALRTAVDLAEGMGTFDEEKAAHLRAILTAQPEPPVADEQAALPEMARKAFAMAGANRWHLSDPPMAEAIIRAVLDARASSPNGARAEAAAELPEPTAVGWVMVPMDRAAPVPDYDECARQATLASGLPSLRNAPWMSTFIREINRWCQHRYANYITGKSGLIGGWRQDGAHLYRTDGDGHTARRDEIIIATAEGSQDRRALAACAAELREQLNRTGAIEPLRDLIAEIEWCIAEGSGGLRTRTTLAQALAALQSADFEPKGERR
ncbi:hypothetical protein [Burkholderia sp. Tr-20390]|uniref:hypothetical protein n=1 Tax=Burkholderia sp. Tr-20390 TaxID=2703904 RepID=UPI001F11FE1E|nr:hypothetical protein [Burkholderia sp. Tr-20390]